MILENLHYNLLLFKNKLTEQELNFIYEREMSAIKSFDVSSIDLNDKDELLEAYKLLYELEFKYNKILSSKFKSGNIKRKENILTIILNKSKQVISLISKTLINVFNEWLNNHDPNYFNEKAEEFIEFIDSDEYLNQLLFQYIRYALVDDINRTRHEFEKNRM